MLFNILHPAFLLAAAALLLPLIPRKLRAYFFVLTALLALAVVAGLENGSHGTVQAFGYSLTLCKVDALSRVFGLIFAFVAAAGGLFALHLKDSGQQVSALLYGAGALGVTFAGDLFTLFVFWELMAVTSTYLIWARGTDLSFRAGIRYLLYHALGGGLLLTGILVLLHDGGGIAVGRISPDQGLGAWLILAGVAVNAAITPLHAWLADAYPKATVTGTLFMSAFTTKSAVYVLARIFPGWEILIVLGVVMALYGVIYAVLADDMREILSYHIICQVGYMVAAVGIGSTTAIDGAVGHAINNVLFKTLMFMAVGSVMLLTGQSRLSRLGGLFSRMPLVFFLYMVGAFSISGFPLFNGFISKSTIIAAATEAHLDWVVLSLLLASIGTFVSVGLKLPYYCWIAGQAEKETAKVPVAQILGMAVLALPCVLFGIYPSLLVNLMPGRVDPHAYTLGHISEMGQMLSLAFIVFWLMRKKLKPHASVLLDLDWFYRRHGDVIGLVFIDLPNRFFDACERGVDSLARKISLLARNPLTLFSAPSGNSEYTPDRYRPRTEVLVLAFMLLFLLAAAAVWLTNH